MNHENSHPPVDRAPRGRRARRRRQAGIERIGADEGAFHRQHHAGGEHRIDERIGIAEQQIALAVAAG
jgi:hypothetical protein